MGANEIQVHRPSSADRFLNKPGKFTQDLLSLRWNGVKFMDEFFNRVSQDGKQQVGCGSHFLISLRDTLNQSQQPGAQQVAGFSAYTVMLKIPISLFLYFSMSASDKYPLRISSGKVITFSF